MTFRYQHRDLIEEWNDGSEFHWYPVAGDRIILFANTDWVAIVDCCATRGKDDEDSSLHKFVAVARYHKSDTNYDTCLDLVCIDQHIHILIDHQASSRLTS